MAKFKKIFLGTMIVTISSQFYIDILLSDFRITCAIIALGLFLYLNEDINPIIMGITVSFSTYIWRTIIHFLTYGFDAKIIGAYTPEIFFYIVYGILFWKFIHKRSLFRVNLNLFFLMTTFCDFTSNIVEISIRIIYYNHKFYFNIITFLLLVALIRSSAVWIILTILKYYKMLILKSEHEKRYRKLLWLTMILKSEMYWMDKNMDKIEKVMTNSYKLFEDIRDGRNSDNWASSSVKIASDVHEIKKEYELVLRGVQEITNNRYKDNGMYFKDIISILEEKMQNEIKYKNLHVKISVERGHDFYTDKHYQLMSIFRNLLMNAFEAIDESKGTLDIKLIHKSLKSEHLFKVIDNGKGISKEDIEFIFSPGFSTKIDYETGYINRGLGLSLVKDVVENHFKGYIEVESSLGSGTSFSIYIPNNEIEVSK
ncbi:ATP-binding protein [Paramaledivibacter caminithermalis]|jgi:two-component system sensor histidine kinase YcbA|uniref:histidine kinase n=1 Tax=Paramaledivibacter caminithermalis (strain DSM 15212 / CIP 107654 / DViRD3) TaxID=1121301 RepID=A0A1M6R899_PARC5|nr:ATP-binding protein [Paramaledivibacter caminithermalis]SHK28691.1 two-component system, sensor histidine kinase YcbA [Paramaledivibacter caminithermalis DSM 15212]